MPDIEISRQQTIFNMAEFLELLDSTRNKSLASGQRPTEIPEDLKAALLRLISE